MPFTLVPSRAIAHDPFLGMAVTNLTKKNADVIGLERPQGALIVSVMPKGVAAAAGVKTGMVVAVVNNQSIPDISAYRAVMKKTLGKKELNLLIHAYGKLRMLRFARDEKGSLKRIK